MPTETVVFDLSTDRGNRTGNQMLTEIMYKQVLGRMGYARDLDLAELEITLEEECRLDEFKRTFARVFEKDWTKRRAKLRSR